MNLLMKSTSLNKGICVISIDYEYAWGYYDHTLTTRWENRIRNEADITKRLLALFEKYRIPATWAIVGHLLEPKGGTKDALWFDAKSLVPQIATAGAGHEIASHSYAHIPYDTSTTEEVLADIKNASRVHKERGYSFTSFVFPRNKEGHHDILLSHGITNFRGTTPRWYHSLPGVLRRLGHFVDYVLPTVPTVVPLKHQSGLVSVPDSMLLFSRKCFRKIVAPFSLYKACRGLEKAAHKKEIFHLWFHPSNFSYGTNAQFKTFEEILRKITLLRDQGKLDVRTMREVAKLVEYV